MTIDDIGVRKPGVATVTEHGPDDLHREITELRCKLASQPVIEEAKGMLMAAFGLSCDHAFELLKALSQTNNVKVREVARQIVECWTVRGPRPDYDDAAAFLVALRRRLCASPGL